MEIFLLHFLQSYEKAFLTDDHATLLAKMHPEVIFSDPMTSPKDITSREDLRKYLAQSNGVMSETVQTVTTRAVDLSMGTVALQWMHVGKNAVTGESYRFPGCTMLKVKEGMVVEHRDFFDPAILVGQFKAAHKHRNKSTSKL